MTPSESLPASPVRSERPVSWESARRWRSRSSSRQLLWGKLGENLALLEIADRQLPAEMNEAERARCIIQQCRQKLTEARDCIGRQRTRPFLFWELIHEVDELLLLVLPEDMLPSRAVEVHAQFERNIKDEALRRHWLGDKEQGPLLKTVARLTRRSAPDEAMFPEDRSILQGALHAVNQQVNKGFWQLSMNVAVQVWSGLLLVVLFILSLFFASPRLLPFDWEWLVKVGGSALGHAQGPVISLVLLGAGGAIVSNMLSKESFIFAIGTTRRYFFYYVLVKPILGGFAGLLVYLLERSALLFEVVVSPAPLVLADPPSASEGILQIPVSSPDQELFILAVIAVAAGYSAERWLGGTMDNVLGRIFNRSEKSVSQVSSGALGAEKRGSAR